MTYRTVPCIICGSLEHYSASCPKRFNKTLDK